MINKLAKYSTIIYSFIKSFITKSKSSVTGHILIIEGGHIGDLLMDASALVAIVKHYQRVGKNVSFLCSPPLWDMLLRIDNMQGVTYIGQAYTYDLSDYSALGQTIHQLKRKNYDMIICVHNADSRIHCLTACLNAREKYCVVTQFIHRGLKGKLKLWLLHHYTHIIWGDRNRHQIRWMEQLLRELKIDGYIAENVRLLPPENTPCKKKTYIAIAVDSSDLAKRWSAQSYIDLINYLLKTFDDDICLIGKTIDPELDAQLTAGSLFGNNRLIDTVGRTSIEEWIELIRESKFLVGVDSGSIHVAVAVGTISFCLAGVWSGHKCLPYDVDRVVTGTKLPVYIYRQDLDIDSLPCYDCGFHGGYGTGNEDCLQRCKAGQPCLCLSKITPDDVLNAIHHAQEIDEI